MRTKKYPVRLSQEEQKILRGIISKGKHSATIVKRANILLCLDENSGKVKYQHDIAIQCHTCIATINSISRRYAQEGLMAIMKIKKRLNSPITPIATGDIEAKIIQLACSEPPAGRSRWTLRLLEKKVVELGIVPAISDNTIGRLLKKRHLNLI